MRRADLARALPLLALLLITLYGTLLRLDALVTKYGTVDHPRWAAVLTGHVAPLGARLRPYDRGWPAQPHPYQGGDPINYLRFAREMTHFYQPHVREPVFLAVTRGYLWLLSDQDVAVSFASATGSVLAIVGTYLLAAVLMPPLAALGAALVVAVEFDLITWAVDGWRDDLFTACVLWTAWAFLRLRRTPSGGNALLVGTCASVACLTRITALSFVLPALLWTVVDAAPGTRRERIRMAAVALAVMTALVAPYVISCAIATGDPLYAINYHTIYYRHGEGMPIDETMSVSDYLATKFARHPAATLDTGFMGLFVEPFITKWGGLAPIVGGARRVLVWGAVAGLVLLPFSAAGRLLLVALFGSLLPYAWTWNVGGGNAWRFTMHAYPIYIVAAFCAVACAWSTGAQVRAEGRAFLRKPSRRIVVGAAAVLSLAAAGSLAYVLLPWLVVRERIGRGEDVNIEAGPRDAVFFRGGWSRPHRESIMVRVSLGERSHVYIPLPARAPYELALRLDPVVPGSPQRVTVLFNGPLVARFELGWNPERVGSYRLRLQPHQVRIGRNELTLVPETLVPAASAGPRFAWLPPADQIGIRLWYVRVRPGGE
ncbi:MAG: ArnT family glycosyltransferase [Vicinamibacterales bacterium]